MYGVFTYIYHKNQPNVGKYTIHGSLGICIKEWIQTYHKRVWFLFEIGQTGKPLPQHQLLSVDLIGYFSLSKWIPPKLWSHCLHTKQEKQTSIKIVWAGFLRPFLVGKKNTRISPILEVLQELETWYGNWAASLQWNLARKLNWLTPRCLEMIKNSLKMLGFSYLCSLPETTNKYLFKYWKIPKRTLWTTFDSRNCECNF